MEKEPRLFQMVRNNDETGVSGTGKVLTGIEFEDGTVAVKWECLGKPNSLGIFDSMQDFLDIHVHSHPTNRTEIIYLYEGKPEE